MQKIISLFCRNYDGDHLVRNDVVPVAEWVIAGEGRATRKWDGTCCMVRAGRLFKRYEATKENLSRGKVPKDFEPANEIDQVTGKQQGWVPVGDGPDDRWHREALDNWPGVVLFDGTYELCGPKIQGNPESLSRHQLIQHGWCPYDWSGAPRTFVALLLFFSEHDVEGVVWHHPDGRMAKIKGKDFGLKRNKLMAATA